MIIKCMFVQYQEAVSATKSEGKLVRLFHD